MLVPIIIAILMVVGVGIHEVTKKDDTPAEQFIEAILRAEGVEYDFSAEDKAARLMVVPPKSDEARTN